MGSSLGGWATSLHVQMFPAPAKLLSTRGRASCSPARPAHTTSTVHRVSGQVTRQQAALSERQGPSLGSTWELRKRPQHCLLVSQVRGGQEPSFSNSPERHSP